MLKDAVFYVKVQVGIAQQQADQTHYVIFKRNYNVLFNVAISAQQLVAKHNKIFKRKE